MSAARLRVTPGDIEGSVNGRVTPGVDAYWLPGNGVVPNGNGEESGKESCSTGESWLIRPGNCIVPPEVFFCSMVTLFRRSSIDDIHITPILIEFDCPKHNHALLSLQMNVPVKKCQVKVRLLDLGLWY